MPRGLQRARDIDGRPLRCGDSVRVLGVPDLSGLDARGLKESLPVFEHIVGSYKRIVGFNKLGMAELEFRIRQGRNAGLHTVWIETHLLRLRSRGQQSS